MLLGSRKSLVLAGGVLLTLGLIGSRAKAEMIVPPGYSDLVYTIETDKIIYSLGEEVHVYHSVTNPLDVSYTFQFTQGPGFFLRVKQDGNTVWEHQTFLLMPWDLTLLPDETVEQEYIWYMLDASGNLVDPGEYELVSTTGGSFEDSSTTITIIPEPTTLVLLLVGLGFTSLRKRR